MYQEIDDPQADICDTPPARSHFWPWLLGAFVLVMLALVGLKSLRGSDTEGPSGSFANAEQLNYRTAMAERSAPLRRARLQDFLTTYPDSPYRPAVNAQLSVLNSAEAEVWSSVTDTLFDPMATREDKLFAIDIYERAWGPSFLGGRDSEIARLRQSLDIQTPAPPTRKLEETPTDFPDSIPDKSLAGAPGTKASPVIIQPPSRPAPAPVTQTAIIDPPKIRRNATPKYPRKALRRNVEGLVVLSLNINAKGRVDIANVVSVEAPQYSEDFVRAAQRAARRTRFFPQTVNGVPQPVSGVIKRYRFSLD